MTDKTPTTGKLDDLMKAWREAGGIQAALGATMEELLATREGYTLVEPAIPASVRRGDIVTIMGPGDNDLLVREVVAIDPNGTPTIAGLVAPGASLRSAMSIGGRKLVRIERPTPEPELPTEPGYYESARYPLKGGYFALRLNAYGEWHRDGVRKTEEQMREHMPLTRLVPEAAPVKLRDRIDLDKMAEHLEHSRAAGDSWRGDAAAILAAIDSGELDK